MATDEKNLFFTLLKLKSYLVSLIDEPSDKYYNFNLSEEYLDRKMPERRDQILDLLESNGIYSDSDIVFNDKIILQFRKIANSKENKINLGKFLNKLDIDSKDINEMLKGRSESIVERETKLNQLLETLFQLATNWAVLKELEDKVDDYSMLNDEELIRPEEEKNLDVLDESALKFFTIISELTRKYINQLSDYYFDYGGDIALKDFVGDLQKTKDKVQRKYIELFNKNGLDSDILKKEEGK